MFGAQTFYHWLGNLLDNDKHPYAAVSSHGIASLHPRPSWSVIVLSAFKSDPAGDLDLLP